MEIVSPLESNSENFSPRVASSQTGPHRDLIRVLQRHGRAAYARPIAGHTRDAFAWVRERIAGRERGLVLDSGCGAGEAAAALSRQYPDCWVIGVDRSAHRLGKAGWSEPGRLTENLLLVRADLVDFWRLAVAAGWRLERHYLLYPNPWPKPAQLKRRWHAHPVFKDLLALGGLLELRTNWRVYAEEFVGAVTFLEGGAATVQCFQPRDCMTPFERKFSASGHRLFRVEVALRGRLS